MIGDLNIGSMSPFSLQGRVALVTGSSAGLGKAMAMSLGQAGAKVALNYSNNAARAEQSFKEFRERGFSGMLARADVTDEEAVTQLAEEVKAKLGPIDILVLNATCDQPHQPVEKYDWDFFQSMVDFFIKSPFLLTRACVPHMKRQRWGRIIQIGSEVVERGAPNFTAYVAAKGGQNGFGRSLATELAPFGITVNMVSPGWIPVERHEKDSPAAKQAYLSGIPAGRWGVPADVGGAVVFLGSDAASFITGQNLGVDGGTTNL
jgi:3-oxoacyl-[acyl-carrier protein] reductase